MSIKELKQRVFDANLALVKHGLVIFTWGNVSEIDRASGLIAIKPSGVSYEEMKPEDITVLDLDGKMVEGRFKPSSDTPTHIQLYKSWNVGAVVHTHSTYAVAWAQSQRSIPCYGTTHADYFFGAIPCTRRLTKAEIETDYERNTGNVIVETFKGDPQDIPSVIVACHGPFSWGKDAFDAVHNAVVLEETAKMAQLTESLNRDVGSVEEHLLKKHYLRKHGANAYYGQKKQ